jgi:hypothetical protein
VGLKNLSLPFLGFLQATGILIYVSLVSAFIGSANKIFGPISGFLGPIAFLLLFIVSAMITGSLAMARAGVLFWEKRYKQSFTLIGWTLGWCVFYLVSVFILLFVYR